VLSLLFPEHRVSDAISDLNEDKNLGDLLLDPLVLRRRQQTAFLLEVHDEVLHILE